MAKFEGQVFLGYSFRFSDELTSYKGSTPSPPRASLTGAKIKEIWGWKNEDFSANIKNDGSWNKNNQMLFQAVGAC